jgi:YVTN family beta-propeller protein
VQNTISYCITFLSLLAGGSNFSCATPDNNTNIEPNVLTLTAKIILPNVSGRIDHIAFDVFNELAFVAALGNNTIEVVNIKTNEVVHTIKGLREPQGVAYIPLLKRLVVANDGDGKCIFFDATTYQQLKVIDLKDDADNVRYDETSHLVYVGYGSGGIAIIDANTMNEIASIPLDGHPESFQLDKKQNRIYVNVPDADEIEVADLSTRAVVSKWKNVTASSNFPMALDTNNDRLFIGCRNPATLHVVNTQTGKETNTLNCSGDADDVFYDGDNLVFLSAGRGFIDVLKTNEKSELTRINHIATRSGARTSLFIPSEKILFVAVPQHSGEPAELWVFKLKKSA